MKFDSLYKMKITSSESKDHLRKSGKGLITSMGLKAKVRPYKFKRARYTIRNVSKKDLSKIIREFEKLPYESYVMKRPKHERTDSYFYLSGQLVKCMMRANALNFHSYPVRTEMTGTKHIPALNICYKGESELKEFLVNENFSQICSKDKDGSKGIIGNECSTEKDEL